MYVACVVICVCIYIYIYIHIHVYIYIYIYIQIEGVDERGCINGDDHDPPRRHAGLDGLSHQDGGLDESNN